MATSAVDISRALLGPLTTTFTPSPSCTSLVACVDCDVAYQAQLCRNDGSDDFTGCWPEAENAGAPTPTLPLFGWGFYSPGLACPTGHYTACAATAGLSGTWDPQFSLTAGETAVGCCPSGYTCASIYTAGTCRQEVTRSVIPTVSCVGGTLTAFGPLTVPTTTTTAVVATDGTGVSQSIGTISSFELFAPLFQLNFQSSDLSSSSTSSPTSSSATTAEPASSASSGSDSSGSSDQAPGEGLSTGAKAGIGIGAGLGAVGVALLVYFLIWRRRRARNLAQGGPGSAEYRPGDYPGYFQQPNPAELEHKQNPSELAVQARPAELPADGSHGAWQR